MHSQSVQQYCNRLLPVVAASEMKAVPAAILKRHGAEWKIAAFQNTLVQSPPLVHNNGQSAGR